MKLVTIRIATTVKMHGAVYMPGTHEVEPEVAEELAFAGVLVPEGEPEVESAAPAGAVPAEDLEHMVAERAAIVAKTLVENAVEQAVAKVTAERDEAAAAAEAGDKLVAEVTRERDEAIARADAAEKALAATQSDTGKTGAEGDAAPAADAEDAPKKGAAATKG